MNCRLHSLHLSSAFLVKSFFPTSLASLVVTLAASLLVSHSHAEDKPAPKARDLCAAHYPSIQAAIDANPGCIIDVPSGDYVISQKIYINKRGGGLTGFGRIIQTNPDAPILEVEHATGVVIRDLTLTRPEGKQDTRKEGLLVSDCRDTSIDHVKVLANRTLASSVAVRSCEGTQIRNCLVRDYSRISVDDRTATEIYGYAFKCIDGTGMVVDASNDTLIEGCRVIEETMIPTPEVQKQYELGKFTKKNPVKGALISQKTWDAGQTNIWHQGSAIVINSPEHSQRTQVINNQITNAAQGLDIHADHVTIQGNIISNASIGMKAMHGSRHVLIIGNQFIKNDLWSIGLMPGAAAHPAVAATADKPAVPENGDGGSIIANNIISDFGNGHAHWIWGEDGTPIRLDNGQMPDDPPLSEVLVSGNMVYDSSRDSVPVEEPRYRYAVRISAEVKGLHFSGNVFHPGAKGVSNAPMNP